MKQNLSNWLEQFLLKYELSSTDGRHLFAYHPTSEDIENLTIYLQDKIKIATYTDNPFLFWKDNDSFCALFVLYASSWWQKNYDGGRLKWEPIMNSLFFPLDSWSSGQMGDVVKRGLQVWKLKPSSNGHTYLGAIAREAGLPQKLFSEHKGSKVGEILRKVLRQAQSGVHEKALIFSWVSNMKDRIPMSYRNEIIIDLLTESIISILELQQILTATSSEEAFKELEKKKPLWKKDFPLPLDDSAAHELLNQLLNDITTSVTIRKSAQPIIAERRLRQKINSNTWQIETIVHIPQFVQLPDGNLMNKFRTLLLDIVCGNCTRTVVLRKHAENSSNSSYIPMNHEDIVFSNESALREVVLHFRSNTGEEFSTYCQGGNELDDDLPWIFEQGNLNTTLRRQGGGSVRSQAMLVVSNNKWKIQEDQGSILHQVGKLEYFSKHIYQLSGNGFISKEDLSYRLITAMLAGDTTYTWGGQRIWDFVTKPYFTFCETPYPILQTNTSSQELRQETLYWKRSGQSTFEKLTRPIYGVLDLWFQSSDGANLRNRMLIIPKNARVDIQPLPNSSGKITFENWQIESISLVKGEEQIELKKSKQGNSFSLQLYLKSGQVPPEYIDLIAHWIDCPDPVRLRVPFPMRGVRLFNSSEKEIAQHESLCVSDLFGTRLYCITEPSRIAHVELYFSIKGQGLVYSIKNDGKNFLSIRLQDWQRHILEVLSTSSDLDARVTLQVSIDGVQYARWSIARYRNELLRTEEDIYLKTIENHSIEVLQQLEIEGFCLTYPPATVQQCQMDTSQGVPTGTFKLPRWFPCNGSWLFYENKDFSTIRPVLWYVDNAFNDYELDNRLLQAIGAPSDTRQSLFKECFTYMCEFPTSPEWETFKSIIEKLKHLPLSTLDIWKSVARSSKIMATIAFRPDIDFKDITARASTELPFHWTNISRQDWHYATKHLEKWCTTNNAMSAYDILLKNRREEIGTHCSITNGLLHISCPLDSDAPLPDGAAQMLFDAAITVDKEAMFTRHVDGFWPEEFSEIITDNRLELKTKNILPQYQLYRDSVVCLPILLAIQNYTGKNIIFYDDENTTLFSIKRHINFDYEWFETMYTHTIYRCHAEKFLL